MGMALTVPRYTVDDLERFPNDGNRYELLDGMLIVTPAPRNAHQLLTFELAFRLANQTRQVARVWRSRTEHEALRNVIRWEVPTTGIEATIDPVEVFAGFE